MPTIISNKNRYNPRITNTMGAGAALMTMTQANTPMTKQWRDSPTRYGAISRLLHWAMAALLGWQFMCMAVKLIVGRAPLTSFLVGTHKSVGILLLTLGLLRVLWALAQRHRRP